MYNIKDLNEFNKMVKESIIPIVLKEKKDFEKIKENCEKSFIIEINGKHKKILYNIEEINGSLSIVGVKFLQKHFTPTIDKEPF